MASVTLFESNFPLDFEDKTCVICSHERSEVRHGSNPYHKLCLLKWFLKQDSPTCPDCRGNVDLKSFLSSFSWMERMRGAAKIFSVPAAIAGVGTAIVAALGEGMVKLFVEESPDPRIAALGSVTGNLVGTLMMGTDISTLSKAPVSFQKRCIEALLMSICIGTVGMWAEPRITAASIGTIFAGRTVSEIILFVAKSAGSSLGEIGRGILGSTIIHAISLGVGMLPKSSIQRVFSLGAVAGTLSGVLACKASHFVRSLFSS